MDDRTDREQKVVLRWRTRIRSEALGPSLDRAYPTDPSDGFDEALKAIDEAENEVWGNRDPADQPPK